MTPLTAACGLRVTAAVWCTKLADRLTAGGMTRTMLEAERTAANLADVEQANARLTGERQQALDAAEDAWNAQDRAKAELRTARDHLRWIGDLMAARGLIEPAVSPDRVRAAVDAAFGPDASSGPVASVATDLSEAIKHWTRAPGKAGLLDNECAELGWLCAAAASGWLRTDLTTGGTE